MQLLRIKNLEIFTISVISKVWFTRTAIREPHLSQMSKNQPKHHKTLYSYNTVGFEVSFLLLCCSLLHRSIIIPKVIRSHLHFAAMPKVILDHGLLPWCFLLWSGGTLASLTRDLLLLPFFLFNTPTLFRNWSVLVLLFCLVVFGFVSFWRFFYVRIFWFGVLFGGDVLLENKTSIASLTFPCI